MNTNQNNNSVDNLGRFHIARDLQDWLGESQTVNKNTHTEDQKFSDGARKAIKKLESVSSVLKRDYSYI